jgi:hypothetical protein
VSLMEWFESHHGITHAESVRVTIGRTTYDGVLYKQTMETPRNTHAYVDGEREYQREAIYLLGDLPAAYRRRKSTCFTITGDEREWYIGSWNTREVANDPEYAKFHYEGNAGFQLMPWTADSKIDDHARTPYQRVAITVER